MRQDLDRLEKRWGLAVQSANFGVWDLDVCAQSVHYSPQWKAMLGYPDTDEADATHLWRARVHPDDLEAMLTALSAHLDGSARAYEHEFRLRCADGSYRWVLSRGRVVERGERGEPVRAIGTLVDLTDRHEAERLRAERDRAQASSRDKTEFLRRMSHELRTPLNAVLGFSQLLARPQGVLAPAVQRRYAEQIECAGWRLLRMVDDVLDLSSIESGSLDVRAEPVALAPLVDSVVLSLVPLARERAVRVSSRGMLQAAVLADRERLRQVLSNLLDNAIRYNRPHGSVAIEASASVQDWRLSVIDTGQGISAAQLPHLFEPFNRLGRGSSGAEGVGIGLVLAKSLVERMGGQIVASSEAGVGSRFDITLPRVLADVSQPL